MSDFQLARRIKNQGVNGLSQREIYCASIVHANTGQKLHLENDLPRTYQLLLDIRRQRQKGNIELAHYQLSSLDLSDQSPFTKGEKLFILGNILFDLGNFKSSSFHFDQASEKYLLENDIYRNYRSKVNCAIAEDMHLSRQTSRLESLRSEITKASFDDLAGNIAKSNSIDLLVEGKLSQAKQEALTALHHYCKEGCSEDSDIAMASLAIIESLYGNNDKARVYLKNINLMSQRVRPFAEVARSIVMGHSYNIPSTHPLFGLKWNIKK